MRSTINAAVTAISGLLNRTNRRQNDMDLLHEAIFSKGYLEMDPIAAVEGAETSRNTIVRPPQATIHEDIDPSDSESSTHLSSRSEKKLRPLPDVSPPHGRSD